MNKEQFTIVALLISIAINLLLIGGMGYRMLTLPEARMRPLPPSVGWMLRDLSEERREELQPLIEAADTDIDPARGAMFAAQTRVNELMRAEIVDNDAIADALAELREASLRYQTLSHEQTVTLLAELTEEERRAALEFISRRGPGGRGGPGGPGGFRPPPGGGPGGPPPPR